MASSVLFSPPPTDETTSAQQEPLLNTENNDNENDETEAERRVPPMRQHWQRFRCIVYQCRFALALVAATWLGVPFLYHNIQAGRNVFLSYHFYPRQQQQQQEGSTKAELAAQLQDIFQTSFVLLAVILLTDAYYCLQSAISWEQRILVRQQQQSSQEAQDMLLEQTDNNQQQDQTEGNLAEGEPWQEEKILAFSKAVDGRFQSSSSTCTTTFLVGLLYALFATSLWLANLSITTSLWLWYSPQASLTAAPYLLDRTGMLDTTVDNYDDDDNDLTNSPDFDKLPLDVQNWIRQDVIVHPNPWKAESKFKNPLVPYLKMADDTMIFPFIRQNNGHAVYDQEKDRNNCTGIAVIQPQSSSIQEYPLTSECCYEYCRVGNKLVGLPNQEPYYAWCAVAPYSEPSTLHDEVLCGNLNKGNMTVFPAVTEQTTKNGWSGFSYPERQILVSGYSMWIVRHMDSQNEKERQLRDSVTKYDVSTMERKVVVEVVVSKPVHSRRGSSSWREVCPQWYRVSLCTSLAVLGLTFLYLYRRDVSSCTVPVAIAVSLLFNNMPEDWSPVALLVTAGLLTWPLNRRQGVRSGAPLRGVSISKYVTTEMFLWIQYTLLASVVVGSFWEVRSMRPYDLYRMIHNAPLAKVVLVPCCILILLLTNALLLNHPIFEMIAIFFGCCFLGTLVSFLIRGPVYWLASFVLFALAWCCWTIGSLWQHCRLHTLVYCRRGWRYLRPTRSRE